MWGRIKQWWGTKQVLMSQGPMDGKTLVINKNTNYLYFPYRDQRGISKKFRHVYIVYGKKATYYGVERTYGM